jgi:hypothetical protein
MLAGGGAGTRTPQLIAQPFAGHGGVGWRSGNPAHGVGGGAGAWRGALGVAWRQGREPPWSLEGSVLAHPAPGAQPDEGEFYASVERRHWGPGWSGSLILDGAAAALPALGWRRTAVRPSPHPLLGWLGPFGADMFAARLQGHLEPRRPHLVGLRARLAPHERFEIGLTRTMMWGGRGRDESARSLFNALIGNDNVGFDGINSANEPGNQLAGWDLRWIVDPVAQVALYTQVVGEDEAGHLPSRNMVLLGVDARWPAAEGTVRFFLEWVDTLAGRISNDPRPVAAYRHPVYRQGYTHEGTQLGHPLGGDAKLAVAGWLWRRASFDAQLMLAAGRGEPTAQSFAPGRILGATGALRLRPRAGVQVGLQTQWWADTAGHRRSAQVVWQAEAF